MNKPGPTRKHACPTCPAMAGQECITKNGKPLGQYHLSRQVVARGDSLPETFVSGHFKTGPFPSEETLHFQSVRCPTCDRGPGLACKGYHGGHGHAARRDLSNNLLLGL